MSAGDTIFALSSPPGRGGVAVFRVSGPDARTAFGLFHVKQPAPRVASRATLRTDVREPIDDALVLWFPGPKSFTGEDSVELHTHSGLAVIQAVLDALGAASGFRLAEPGEFARRAFDHGKIDLVEAEGLLDLIDAETQAQRRQALRQYGGALSALYEAWQHRIADWLAQLEAEIDFGDEGDVVETLRSLDGAAIEALIDEMDRHLADSRQGEILRTGLRVAIVGAPNVGKSSLLNSLAKRDAAIVSEFAGTTRDRIEVALDIAGFPVHLVDTAGLRETADPVEQEGVRRSLRSAQEADLVLDVRAVGSDPLGAGFDHNAPILRVLNKGDLLPEQKLDLTEDIDLVVSAHTGAGIDRLEAALAEKVGALSASETPVITRERHRLAVTSAQDGLKAVLLEQDPVLAAERLRRSLTDLARVVGRLDVEQLLDRIFSQFCIGK
ncbi:MAG: tRNA uridine-5-carboxymethylaminomethyl(34) synthesis GTPase MnmE [Alphaproteobacteria bacterium]|nr:tRNA uridine-5-carboxymethylaminomethyl(34) synthesis GTPase MnmE [Alphaproteobacteria bacterium]